MHFRIAKSLSVHPVPKVSIPHDNRHTNIFDLLMSLFIEYYVLMLKIKLFSFKTVGPVVGVVFVFEHYYFNCLQM